MLQVSPLLPSLPEKEGLGESTAYGLQLEYLAFQTGGGRGEIHYQGKREFIESI